MVSTEVLPNVICSGDSVSTSDQRCLRTGNSALWTLICAPILPNWSTFLAAKRYPSAAAVAVRIIGLKRTRRLRPNTPMPAPTRLRWLCFAVLRWAAQQVRNRAIYLQWLRRVCRRPDQIYGQPYRLVPCFRATYYIQTPNRERDELDLGSMSSVMSDCQLSRARQAMGMDGDPACPIKD